MSFWVRWGKRLSHDVSFVEETPMKMGICDDDAQQPGQIDGAL